MTATVTMTVTTSFFEEEGKKEEANLDGESNRHSSYKEEGKREDANCDRIAFLRKLERKTVTMIHVGYIDID